MISNFSLRPRLHLVLLWGDLDERMCHEIKWSMLFKGPDMFAEFSRVSVFCVLE